jgi:xylose isomerase
MDEFDPHPDDRFTFGLWTVGNTGADPFGTAVRAPMAAPHIVHKLAECGAHGVNLHDNDLVPLGASAAERDTIVRDFKRALQLTGMQVPMATVNLFGQPVFRDGAFTANDPKVRAYALQKTMAAMDLGAELGAKIFVLWGGREGVEADACRSPIDAIRRMRDSLDYLCEYSKSQGHGFRFALEAKPNEPRGDIYFATTGHMLHLISTLQNETMVGVNPEVAHETMAGLNFTHAVAQALEAGKLFHIDLNGQRIGRYDQDLRFGSEDLKGAFFLVRLLEGTATDQRYDGPLHFDAHAYRTEDEAGVWDFARGCMRTYKILAARARAFDADREVREITSAIEDAEHEAIADRYSAAGAATLRAKYFDIGSIARRGLRYERLDQLTIEYVLGVKS